MNTARIPVLFVTLLMAVSSGRAETAKLPYRQQVLQDNPVAYWSFTSGYEPEIGAFQTTVDGKLELNRPGPRKPDFPLFDTENQALGFVPTRGFLRVQDPGDKSPLDFDSGDSITIEAWVEPTPLSNGQFSYIIGKGRTNNKGVPPNNQNYALRLQGSSGGAALTFLFRSRGKNGDWHRWTSNSGVTSGDGWHHVALTYTFGKKDSLRAYIDGESVSGKWDMGGATDKAPVVDNDEVWIGSSMGGGNNFQGNLDEIAVYRSALSAEKIRQRFEYVAPEPVVDLSRVPEDKVLVDIYENLPNKKTWRFRPPTYIESYFTDCFGFPDVPKKYSDKAIQVDRSNPFLIRAYGYMTLPEGPRRILVRSRNSARLYMDGKLIVETPFHSISGDAHGRVFEVDTSLAPNIRPLHRGDSEAVVEIQSDGKRHLFQLETIVGGQNRRPELGETAVFHATPDGDFQLLSQSRKVVLTDEGWERFADEHRDFLTQLNAERRKTVDKDRDYWNWRHELARKAVDKSNVPSVAESDTIYNDIDRFIAAAMPAEEKPTPLMDDLEFLRRVTVDVIGTVPTLQQIREFETDKRPDKRARVIDKLLNSPGWADNWVGYWQDVLAENPNIINPTLNNTGPFRWWIHESFLDNKPFDRFVTELVMMEGSKYFGGPGGFEMSTQNDVPMAAKAHVIGQAFLALQMKCARCHDAPAHDFLQRDLFSMAAMLKRGPQEVPLTSSIPGGEDAVRSLAVAVTLKPGESVKPEWPFEEIINDDIPQGVLRNSSDMRERLAALITLPQNRRFAQTIVNRIWKRYMGLGLVEPVEDWEYATPTHPELLDYLADELIANGYDLKHIARLIFNSHAYQRKARGREVVTSPEAYSFATPVVRRLTAEQLVDSLIVVSGKPYDAGPMNIDIDTARVYTVSLNLGEPDRAWQFTSMSNERDRPSLALPFAQPFVSILETFGWRGSRQDPVNERESEPTVLQPAEIANGVLSRRIHRLSDDSAFTALALEDLSVDELINRVYLRVLSRYPTAEESQLFRELLAPGYEDRRVANAPIVKRPWLPRNLVGWSNHLDPQANVIKVQLQEAVEQGDPPTKRLQPEWRERLEDMIWTLTNTPEFVFLP